MELWKSRSRAEKTLGILFLLTIPFVQPQIRGDGIGYYAWAHSLLINHNLQFQGDWTDPATLPVLSQVDKNGRIIAVTHYTENGHLANFYPVGPALLWAPFLVVTHATVIAANHLGFHVSANGFSRPYLMAMAVSTALYGFLSLCLSLKLSQRYIDLRWVLPATIGIWFASSLPVYMYVDPAWSHAHSAFTVALFLWYWDLTRNNRATKQWILLGLISGLMLDVYYANAVFLLVPFLEGMADYLTRLRERSHNRERFWKLLVKHIIYGLSVATAFSPTLIGRKIVFGSFFAIGGYVNANWNWTSPKLWSILFASNHGLLIATPILIPAIVGIILLSRCIAGVAVPFLAATIAFYLLISVYPWWDGVASFGNRFFVSLTPIFVMGLACAIAEFARLWGNLRGARLRTIIVLALLIVWNLGLIFQWSTGLMANTGPVDWQEVIYNQFHSVPAEAARAIYTRFAIL